MNTVQERQADYQQLQGEAECRLIYLHPNGEYEGFLAFGNSLEDARNNCIERIKSKSEMIGKVYNNKRVFDEDILTKLPSLDVQLIKDDFHSSKRGEKF